MVFSPCMKGLSMSAMNGISMGGGIFPGSESGPWLRKVNDRFTGLAIGLINYTRELDGVQIGLLNYAGNNPGWAKLLPFVNVHL